MAGEVAPQEAEVAAVEFHPEGVALQMLQPACPQIPPPVVLDPVLDGPLAEVAAGLLALDPLEAVGLVDAVGEDAAAVDRCAGRQVEAVRRVVDLALGTEGGDDRHLGDLTE